MLLGCRPRTTWHDTCFLSKCLIRSPRLSEILILSLQTRRFENRKKPRRHLSGLLRPCSAVTEESCTKGMNNGTRGSRILSITSALLLMFPCWTAGLCCHCQTSNWCQVSIKQPDRRETDLTNISARIHDNTLLICTVTGSFSQTRSHENNEKLLRRAEFDFSSRN